MNQNKQKTTLLDDPKRLMQKETHKLKASNSFIASYVNSCGGKLL